MKTIYSILLALLFANCQAQTIVNINTQNRGNYSNKYFKDINNNFQNFEGTWENTTGNKTFRVIIWKEEKVALPKEENAFEDKLYGRFLIIQNAGTSSEVILHNSVKYYPQNNITTNWSLLGSALDSNVFGTYIMDTCANGGDGVIDGTAKMEITNFGSTPSTAHWTVKSVLQLQPGQSFSVPTDCILTKVN